MSSVTTKNVLKVLLPPPLWRLLKAQVFRSERLVRRLRSDTDLGSLRRTTPVSPTDFGGNRGQCVDRYYIEKFLTEHSGDVRGHVLDFADNTYARRFGGAKVTKVDVLHVSDDNPRATIVADLARGEEIPSDSLDCVLCTQVLLFIYDVRAAVRTLYRILKPGGVLLVTVPGIQKISRGDMNTCGDYWRFTDLSLRRLFEEVFPADNLEIKTYGNVLAAVAFLHGFAAEDLREQDLEYNDPDFQVSITLRAVKPRIASPPEGLQRGR